MADQFEVGMRLHAKYSLDGKLYPATVKAISSSKKRSKAPVKVEFAGYGEEWKSVGDLKSKKRPTAAQQATARVPRKPVVRGTMPTNMEHPLTLGPLLDRGGKVQPNCEIITKTAGGYLRTTHSEQLALAKQLAAALVKNKVQEGHVVSTFAWNNSWHLQLYHAVPCIGAILNPLNIRLSEKEIAWIINDAGTRVLVVDEDLLPKIEKVFAEEKDKVKSVKQVIVCGLDGGKWTGSSALPCTTTDWQDYVAGGDVATMATWRVLHEDAACMLNYTSGTTGNPKGVAYSHRSTYLHILTQGNPDMMNVTGSDTLLSVVPMFHAAGWAVPFLDLMLGSKIVLVNRFMKPGEIADTIIEMGVTHSCGVPAIWQFLRSALTASPEKMEKVRGVLKTLCTGGSAPPYEMMMWFLKELKVEFRHLWGMTEMNPLGSCSSFLQTQRDHQKTDEQRAENLRYQGMPTPSVDWYIADPDDLEKILPHDGEHSGELLVKGPWVTVGYWGGVGKDKFHNGYLKTGDVASITPTDVMHITDRSKDLVKSGGEFISSIDLENTITGMPSVSTCCVVAIPHPKWDERPIAIVVPPEGQAAPSRDDVVKFLADSRFTKFQYPDDILEWKAIPMTGTGKMDKKNVRKMLHDEDYLLPELRSKEHEESVEHRKLGLKKGASFGGH